MDGTKYTADTSMAPNNLGFQVGGCLAQVEALLKGCVDCARIRILSRVTAKKGENPFHLKGQGSSTMIVS